VPHGMVFLRALASSPLTAASRKCGVNLAPRCEPRKLWVSTEMVRPWSVTGASSGQSTYSDPSGNGTITSGISPSYLVRRMFTSSTVVTDKLNFKGHISITLIVPMHWCWGDPMQFKTTTHPLIHLRISTPSLSQPKSLKPSHIRL
jgi:hypothetical protein